ncbi:MAG: PEP/pyruvate-binding domain-containing protein, partial [Candidatus Diapherotrites archaeon]|nr:PEP/pyruvate-binding domain-containing protein [Candidatus Diapherotrites archaeon]
RSSAIFEDSGEASWAGQLETFTNIQQNNILEHIKKCWASLFSQRACAYYHNQKEKKALEMGVVVQEMVDAKVSGICFTANPVTKNQDEILIEAGFGIGENIVGGKITPDLYVVDKKTLEIKKIAKQALLIEEHYGVPQDTEWAIKGNNLFFLQARPITTL